MAASSEIINLNVGGTRFSTSRQTLTWVQDTFFTAMLSGRISSMRDETGAIFIDRDPKLFGVILNYLRTRDIDLSSVDLDALRHEAEFYGLQPLVGRLALCQDLTAPTCGSVLFHGLLQPAVPPPSPHFAESALAEGAAAAAAAAARPGSIVRLPETPRSHSRQSSADLRFVAGLAARPAPVPMGRPGHSRGGSLDLRHPSHSRSSSADLSRLLAPPGGGGGGGLAGLAGWHEAAGVRIIRGHHNWLVAAYAHHVSCYRMKDSTGWHLFYTSPYITSAIDRVAINAKVVPTGSVADASTKMLGISCGASVHLWRISEDGSKSDVGQFSLGVPVEHLFFIGPQLVALSSAGRIGVWHAMTHHWQAQEIGSVSSFDRAGSFLLLGGTNGCIYYIDMQKFPLRMKDNDLLVTELYHDASNDPITAISVYLTPKTSKARPARHHTPPLFSVDL
ncbi:BTB/POZ domain-containing protein KCTD3-like [Amphibalanus amphitrite]|uniref:BTB/POZ domain-containing protein KCTD3-like n=1 Tax=Amphibalanus amphitrite TaxID=1232801 RepID=UPI001C8FC84D|nr:BTB/POZ domain-containing protein KCTD3-like [Amphibalanus amphitrite]